jgi:hypothetical protein
MTIRSGNSVSWIALPSRRNSGFEATANSQFSGRSARCANESRRIASTQFPLPIGTVDLFTTTVNVLSRFCATLSAADRRYRRSGLPSSADGVCTATKTTSAPGTPSA